MVRSTPQSASSLAKRASCDPLVVGVNRPGRGRCAATPNVPAHDVLADERPATGEPQLAGAAFHESRANARLERWQLLLLRSRSGWDRNPTKQSKRVG
jgi:hypothetical protein